MSLPRYRLTSLTCALALLVTTVAGGAPAPPAAPDDAAHYGVGRTRTPLGLQLGAAVSGSGVRIAAVVTGGAGAAAGLQAGDVVISVNGRRVRSPAEVADEVQALAPDVPVLVEVDRGGTLAGITVLTGGAAARLAGHDRPPEAAATGGIGAWGGLELAAVSPGLGRYFGVRRGVLVVRAAPDAWLALRDGDVITAIDGREPDGLVQALAILRSYRPGEGVTLTIVRDHQPRQLAATRAARAAAAPQRR